MIGWSNELQPIIKRASEALRLMHAVAMNRTKAVVNCSSLAGLCVKYESLLTEEVSPVKEFTCGNCNNVTKNVRLFEFSLPVDRTSRYYEVRYLCMGRCVNLIQRLHTIAHFKTDCSRMLDRQKTRLKAEQNEITETEIFFCVIAKGFFKEGFIPRLQEVIKGCKES